MMSITFWKIPTLRDKMITHVLCKRWDVDYVRERPDHLFIYGDNLLQRGKRGQAIIRDEPNAYGIPTKLKPSMDEDAFMTDESYEDNCKHIDSAFQKIKEASERFTTVVWPADGLGTGLAQLPTRAPRTYKYLLEAVKSFKEAKWIALVYLLEMKLVVIGHARHGKDTVCEILRWIWLLLWVKFSYRLSNCLSTTQG